MALCKTILKAIGGGYFIVYSSLSWSAAPPSPKSIPSKPILNSVLNNTYGPTVQTTGDGTRIIDNPDGSSVQIHPDGSLFIVNSDGSTIQKNADGSEIDHMN